MAQTTTTTLATVVPAESIQDRLLLEARAFNVVAPLVFNDTQGQGMGKVWNQSIIPSVAVAAVTEASDITATARTTTEATITVAEVGGSTDITDFSQEIAKTVAADVGTWAAATGRGIAEKVTSDLCDLFASLNSSTAIGTSGTNITVANFLEAKFTLMNANAIGTPRCVLHPRQITDLANAISASTGTPFAAFDQLVTQGVLPGGSEAGFFGLLFGVGVWHTTECPTANSSADRVGAMFTEQAMGLVTLRPIRTELERNASARSTEIVVTAAYGVGEIRDAFGVPLTTDA